MHAQLFELVMENDPNLVFVKDENSVILFANKAFLEVYPPEKRDRVVGTTTVEDFSPEEAALWLAEDRRALERGRTEMVEEIVDHAGRRRVFLTRKIAFRCVTGDPRLLGICTDITALAEREKELVSLNDRLAQFAALAAHDLRSPLASFVSALDMIERDRDTTLGPRSTSYVAMMRESAFGLASHVNSVLVAAKADGIDGIDRRATDLNLLVEEMRFNVAAFAERTGATIHAGRMPKLDVEPHLFRQLLQNLVENAIKNRSAAPPMIIIRHEETDAAHVFSVEDNGKGVAPEDMQRVFEAFVQGPSAQSGIGVGLVLCRRVAELHAGKIRIDPRYEGGCRVVVELSKSAEVELVRAA